jgi:hypothetical protein
MARRVQNFGARAFVQRKCRPNHTCCRLSGLREYSPAKLRTVSPVDCHSSRSRETPVNFDKLVLLRGESAPVWANPTAGPACSKSEILEVYLRIVAARGMTVASNRQPFMRSPLSFSRITLSENGLAKKIGSTRREREERHEESREQAKRHIFLFLLFSLDRLRPQALFSIAPFLPRCDHAGHAGSSCRVLAIEAQHDAVFIAGESIVSGSSCCVGFA